MSNTSTSTKSIKSDEPAMAKNPRIKTLEAVVTDVDALSQSGFDRINAITRLISISLESPTGYFPGHINTITNALDAIRAIAEESSSCINQRAEDVQCNHKDDSYMRRSNAENLGKQEWQRILTGDAS